MKGYGVVKTLNELNLNHSALLLEEAHFAHSQLQTNMASLGGQANILEVGCGYGVLLSMLAEEFPHHRFSGIEPFFDGFAQLETFTGVVSQMNVNMKTEAYGDHHPEEKYDAIYCVNVFEHVNDWRHFLDWATDHLQVGGKLLVMCPNYGFPYESHFRIPVIVNKYVTHTLFQRYIYRFEKNNDCVGLWDSLNFVKKADVRQFLGQSEYSLRLVMSDETEIIDELVLRFAQDTEFRKRHRFIGGVAELMKKLGILKFIHYFPNYNPYMKLTFTRG